MTPPVKPPAPAARYLRGAMVALALVLPTLSLAVLGTVWLWQNDALLIWALAACATALIVYATEYHLVRRREQTLEAAATPEPDTAPDASPTRPPREQAAWAAVEHLADQVAPDTLDSRDAVLALGAETIATVARHMHPDRKDPLWSFTVPEALALIERVSGQLNRFVVTSVPLGDRLTVAQVLTVYRWRTLATVAEKAYDLWRILRFVNPATAVAGELREKVSRELLERMRTEFTRRLARAYVREVGEAAIDLYSGRLRPDLAETPTVPPDTSDEALAPLELLVVGQAGVGKSSLVNALAEDVRAAVDVVPGSDAFERHALTRDGDAITHVTEAPGLAPANAPSIIDKALEADVIVWVLSASRPDRADDVAALGQLRATFDRHPDRRPPPILFVLTNVDRLRPFNAWDPPYDLGDTTAPKSVSIAAARDAAAQDLGIAADTIVPVAVGQDRAAYNVERVWARLVELFDDARNVQLLRRVADGGRPPLTRSLWRQAVGAGRAVRRKLFE